MKKKTKSFFWLIIAIVIVLAMALRTYNAQKETLTAAEQSIAGGQTLVLNGELSPERLASLLTSNSYIDNPEEALFIAKHIIASIKENGGHLSGIRDLEYNKYGIPLDSTGYNLIASYPGLSLKAKEMQNLLLSVDKSKCPIPNPSLSRKYSVRIKDDGFWGKTVYDTIYICVREYWNDLAIKDGKIVDCQSRDSIYAWIPVTGKASIWLPVKTEDGEERYFSIVPVEKGASFGPAKGTINEGSRRFVFSRKKAVLTLLGEGIMKRMREDNSIAVRSVQEYKEKYITTFTLFVAIWILAFIVLFAIDRKRNGKSNLEILALAVLLSGMGLVTLYNVQNPLWGRFYAWSQLIKGLIPGLILLIACAFIDWTGIYKMSYKAHASKGKTGMQGVWLAIVGFALIIALIIGGSGPGGTRINLPVINIQGSPVIKLLFLTFFAVTYASRKDLIESYALKGQFGKQLLVTMTVLVALLILGVMQLVISDLGPFLIIVITGIFLYSLTIRETVPMLIGSSIFLVLLFTGTRILSGSNYLPFCIYLFWAAGWIAYGYGINRKVYGTPIILSLVLLLTFHGGSLLDILGLFPDVASRLGGRYEMATHIFDNEVRGGSQIAEAIWAITRGGLTGSPGTGLASTMPAGFTDLAGMSLIENFGFTGFVIMMTVMAFLIFLELRIGIRSGHPFAFALCSVIALSFGLQSCMIILGCLGLIPLTGISLPFISYGGTALALELASIGIIISLSRVPDHQLELINTKKYVSMSRAQIVAFVVLATISIGTVMNYGILSRNQYMTKLCKTVDKNDGHRIIVKNPLINTTLEKLVSGDILDRNGNILATTKADGTRDYPYGNKTLFIVGDENTKVLWGATGRHPAGLLAEETFRAKIRGYDTKEITIKVYSKAHYSPYLPDVPMEKIEIVTLEDYSGLVPMMKSPSKIREWNEHKDERNITLTIDAELQAAFQDRIALFIREMQRLGKTTDRTRCVVVIEDATNASLLTSSVYPLPDPAILRERARANAYIYRDWTTGFRAFSDMDLSLVPLAPGSVIKLVSAGAGLKRFSVALAGEQYNQSVYAPEIVDVSLGEPVGSVSLLQAIARSSNIYFIKLVNRYGQYGLYPELFDLYYAVGATFDGMTSYVLFPDNTITGEALYKKSLLAFGETAAKKYSDYEASGQYHRLIDAEYQPAWGQGKVAMTPLALCRYVGAIANDGIMMYPRYEASDTVSVYRQLLSKEEAHVLQDCMKAQAAGRFGEFSSHVGGKTGTPNRTDRTKRNGVSNDAMYCFFIDADGTTNGHPLSVVIRLERVNDYSRLAMQMAREVVLPVLREKGYIL